MLCRVIISFRSVRSCLCFIRDFHSRERFCSILFIDPIESTTTPTTTVDSKKEKKKRKTTKQKSIEQSAKFVLIESRRGENRTKSSTFAFVCLQIPTRKTTETEKIRQRKLCAIDFVAIFMEFNAKEWIEKIVFCARTTKRSIELTEQSEFLIEENRFSRSTKLSTELVDLFGD